MSLHNESNVLLVSTITHTSILQKNHQRGAGVVYLTEIHFTLLILMSCFLNPIMFVRCEPRMYFTFDLNAKHFYMQF